MKRAKTSAKKVKAIQFRQFHRKVLKEQLDTKVDKKLNGNWSKIKIPMSQTNPQSKQKQI
jgi:hypothetical protein